MDLLVKNAIPDNKARHGGLQWVQTRVSVPRGLVFIPPLIGGGPAQQLGAFRWLLKDGLDLFSFNYAGHGKSAGKFSLGASIKNTRRMLSIAANRAEKSGLPLYGIAACYAAIPMLWGARATGEPFQKIVLINPLTAFYQGAFLRSAYRYCKTGFDIKKPALGLKKAIDDYLEFLFPGISRSLAGFGSLSRERTRLLQVLYEWLASNLHLNFSLEQTPALCVYGRRDPLLNLDGGALRHASMACIRTVCSPATFHVIDSDHFFSDPESRVAARLAIRSFLQ